MDRFDVCMTDMERLEHIKKNDCVNIYCGKCPIKNECYENASNNNVGVFYKGRSDIRKEIARKVLDKITKIKELQRILQ